MSENLGSEDAGPRWGEVKWRCGLGFMPLRWHPRGGVCCASGLVFLPLRWHPRGGVCCASGLVFLPLRWHPRGGVYCASGLFFCLCAGIRDLLACFKRRPCAGRHLLFFAAAKKSRQKKAANTASASSCLRAPEGSYASRGNYVTHVRCQCSCTAPHPLRAPALRHAVPDNPPPPRWQTVCRP